MAENVLDFTKVTKSHWETIQQWRVDEGKTYAKSRSSSIARMAAGGMKEGSQQWNDNIARIDEAHAAEAKSQSGSATMGILDRWTEEMKDFYVEASKPIFEKRENLEGDRDSFKTNYKAMQMKASGQANPYAGSGLSEQEFKDLSTEDFMVLQFGNTEQYTEYQTGQETAATATSERRKQSAAGSGPASPWWA